MRKSNIAVALAAAALLAAGSTVAVTAATVDSPPVASVTALVPTGVAHSAPIVPQAIGLRPNSVMPTSHTPVHVDPLIAGCMPGYGDPGSQCIPVKTKSTVTCAWLKKNGYLKRQLVVKNTRDPLHLDPKHTGRACA